MDKAIATIVGIVLVLGLIGYAILGQVSGAKDMGDLASMEQHKVTKMLQNQNIVTGTTVKNYANAGVEVVITLQNGDPMALVEVVDGALFEMSKTFNANGELQSVHFQQVNLSKNK